mgnify:CR=1 FL=1
MIQVFKGFWSIEDVIKSPNKIFIYGDNDLRTGLGGQAIIRNESNTLGIRTKKFPPLLLNDIFNPKPNVFFLFNSNLLSFK